MIDHYHQDEGNRIQAHRTQETESISSLAALYSSSLFAHCCLLSINAGSSSNICDSCLPYSRLTLINDIFELIKIVSTK